MRKEPPSPFRTALLTVQKRKQQLVLRPARPLRRPAGQTFSLSFSAYCAVAACGVLSARLFLAAAPVPSARASVPADQVGYGISRVLDPATFEPSPNGTVLQDVALHGENIGGVDRSGGTGATDRPFQYTVRPGDTLSGIARRYKLQAGSLVLANPTLKSADLLFVGQIVVIPAADAPQADLDKLAQRSAAQTRPVSSPDSVLASSTDGSFVYPSQSRAYLSQPFIPGVHTGVDLAFPLGTPIIASKSGTVVTAAYGYNGGYGTMVSIDHGNGESTLYGHLQEKTVTVGQHVDQGDIIGYSGSTGRSTGPHLHFEIRQYGVPKNPLPYIQ